jgi:site-specific DNA recombinase
MMRQFAWYGRVSTEDQQNPESSRAWQLRRSRELIQPHGGVIVEEFFDVGYSRALPWKRRPEASRLLASFRWPERGFEAVVIGEPQRAFYGAQFALTFPLFEHYGIELWVPEVGGQVDPGSEAHDLLMTLFGGMSKGERARIRTRVRAAMEAQTATEGRFLGGRPPYGYRLADAGAHPNPTKAAQGMRLHCLEPDSASAPIVVRIFEEYISGRGIYAIAEGLTREGIACPSAYDRERNPHRSGAAWSKGAVRAILLNPRYTGIAVWGRQRREEVLFDVEDVAAGHRTKMCWNTEQSWVRSEELAHEPIISAQAFEAARRRGAAARQGAQSRAPRRALRPYLLRRLIRCGLCQRKMEGHFSHGEAYYRCRYPAEYALASELEHPKNVYLREEEVVSSLDDWLEGLFDPERIEDTCEALASAQGMVLQDEVRLAAARMALGECEARLARYRAALEAGANPSVVADWIREVTQERARAEREIRSARRAGLWSAKDIRQHLSDLGNPVDRLKNAAPDLKAALYASLGLDLVFEPAKRQVAVEMALSRGVQTVSEGGFEPP